jgi:hypothetical protein
VRDPQLILFIDAIPNRFSGEESAVPFEKQIPFPPGDLVPISANPAVKRFKRP